MSRESARPHIPRSAVLASCAAIALHALGTWALSGSGWARRGASSSGGQAAVGAGLQVRLAGSAPSLTSEATGPQAEEAQSARESASVSDDAQRLLSQAPAAAGGGALFASSYLSADEVDQGPIPEPGWVLDEGALGQVGRARMRLRLWVSESGHIDRVAVIQADPPGDWVDQAIRPLPDTRMRPALRDGRAVAATVVVELSADLETMR